MCRINLCSKSIWQSGWRKNAEESASANTRCRSRFSLIKIAVAHFAEEGQGFGHFLHAVHAIFDADPAAIVVFGEDAEDGVVIVETLAGNAVAKVGRVAQSTVRLAELFERCAFGQIAIAGMHTHDAIGDTAQ